MVQMGAVEVSKERKNRKQTMLNGGGSWFGISE